MMARKNVYVAVLSFLLTLFCFRVLAQLMQRYLDLPFLPAFAAWQSGAVSYSTLLASQILIIGFYAWLLWRIVTNRVFQNRKWAWVLLIMGLIYFGAMVARIAIGLTGFSEHYWFRGYLPSFFHLVLSSYLIVVGYLQLQTARRQQ